MPGRTDPAPSTLRIAVAGLVALAVAMGIGRFAFTPLMPLMLAEGTLDLTGAGWLASANYFGYLAGALACTFQPWIWRRLRPPWEWRPTGLVRAGLAATVVLTGAMALDAPFAWPALRFAAGVASAFVFLSTSAWCLSQLAQRGVPAMGAVIYAGPGIGIVVSGLAAGAVSSAGGGAVAGWALMGGLALACSAAVWPVFVRGPGVTGAGTAGSGAGGVARGDGAELAVLGLAYGLAGLGYIVTATFLPVIARAALPGSPWLDFFWPLFGVGVVAGALIASRLRAGTDLRLMLAACYAIQAAGVAAGLLSPTLAGFAIGSLLLGLPFTAITFYAMQECRRLRPAQPTGLMGFLTAMYGIGQIVGPPMATALVARAGSTAEGFALALAVAAGALTLGTALYLALWRRYPAAAG